MTRSRLLIVFVFVFVLAGAGAPAAAQPPAAQPPAAQPPAAQPPAAQPDEPVADEAVPLTFDPTTCKKRKSTAKTGDVDIKDVTITTGWKDYEITGDFVDPAKTVRELLGPTLDRNHSLSDDAREEITATAAAFGYHVVGLGTRETPTGTNARLHVAPLPIVRKVDVDVKQGWFDTLFDDEVRRRMRMRPGAYLPWAPDERACVLYEEKRRLEEYLHDEGYFEAAATITESIDNKGTSLKVKVRLGPEYRVALDKIQIPDAGGLPVDVDEIREKFSSEKCLAIWYLCRSSRFTRAQHQADVQQVVEMFHKSGFPAVRVRSDFDPGMSIDRRTKQVSFTISIDTRRGLDIAFEGDHTAPSEVEALRKQLTFDKAASADDVEANGSASAIAGYLQSRGYFDARVTWRREAFPEAGFDRLVYRIDRGKRRTVRDVRFEGNTKSMVADRTLLEAIGTKPVKLSTTILGSNTYATSSLLASDIDRIVNLYRRIGYRDVRVRVSASTDPIALDSAALTAALLAADRGSDLFVRFTIDEGSPTLLTQVRVELGSNGDQVKTPADRALCTQVLRDLAELYRHDALAKPSNPDHCVATAADGSQGHGPLAFREDEVAATKELLRGRLFARGRPRANVEYEPVVIGARRIEARYRLKDTQELKVGKVVIRGNFRTRDSIIMDQLSLKEGQPLTTEVLAESMRRLRTTALFDSVNIKLPDLDTTSAGAVNAVVEVTERYDHRGQVDFELGYSSFNGAFVKLLPSLKNLFGVGISLDLNGTIGLDLAELYDGDLTLRQLSAEATLRFPQLLTRNLPLEFATEVTGFHRRQDTPRFGILRTTGATLALSRTYEFPRTATSPAHAITWGLHYDFRSRERNVDALRPIGADDDESQVPITTRTGSIGLTGEWEQRVDRGGSLSPLSPEGGFRLEGQVSFASPYLLGQDTFLKVSAAGSRFWPIGNHLVLRADLRYDQGFPLGGAALLPEVERFFGGGDSSVRGYNDDRLATEIVQVGVPPLDNITQIRILPAGGNIRVLGSVDAQLRIWKLLSTALFADAGVITNQWSSVTEDDIRPSVGMALVRIVTPFGSFAFERAVPLRPRLGDDPRGRWHLSFAARAQF